MYKLIVMGHARHGKDTVCEILRDVHGYSFKSSSEFCAELFIYDRLKNKYKYPDFETCYKDRHNHRTEWFNLIHDYCSKDLARLGRQIFSKYDIYCGIRNCWEFKAMKRIKYLTMLYGLIEVKDYH